MPAVKSVVEIASKWATVTPQRAPEYEKGVKNPQRNWETNTKASNDAYKSGIQAAITQDKFAKGVVKAGQAKWAKGAIEKGVARFGPGVQVAESDYSKGFAPYRDAIEKAALPPRFARRDPRNLERVRSMVTALIAEKQKQVG